MFGVTLPLLTTAAGEKYGKSAGNAVWLDANKTSVVRTYAFDCGLVLLNCSVDTHRGCEPADIQFDFYQYFWRADDRDVEQLLKSFTFLDVDEIRELVHEHAKAPEKREAQKVLAENITTTMHGAEGLASALAATRVLFGKSSETPLTADQVLSMAGDAPTTTLARADVLNASLVDLCVRVGAAKSKGSSVCLSVCRSADASVQRLTYCMYVCVAVPAECRRLIKGGGLYVNNNKVESESLAVAAEMLLDGKLLLLRTGRRNNFIVQVQ